MVMTLAGALVAAINDEYQARATYRAVLVASAILLSIPAAHPARAGDAPQQSISGELLYASKCSSCHGMDGRGLTPLGGLFQVAPPDLARIASRRGGWFPEVVVRDIIDGRYRAHGESKVPIWGRILSRLEMIAITEHLYALQVPTPENREAEGSDEQ